MGQRQSDNEVQPRRGRSSGLSEMVKLIHANGASLIDLA
jgi:hypothetical protein